ncbi:cache domain-containing protein [Oceanirhabdus sp. W0125-5]|uniref:cache domain-containing protein n=1 Tax=Oceanirhabdus sp. W0125-5 TaxID=2999116 RepID=UPI0022F3343A|nr:cache domain-containing protein [Oceanirhabdus sp. W0125-5]WBW97227.1 cache domain-containing protein [Oceanirhabdus sp. W0125-5]
MTKTNIENNNLKAREKIKLFLKFFSLIGVCMALIVIILFNCVVKGTINSAMEYNMELVRNVSVSIEDYLSDIEKDLEVLSSSKEIQSIAESETDTVENLLLRFEEYNKVHDEVKMIFFATPNNRMYIYPHDNKYLDINLTERPYYVDAVNTKDSVWSENINNIVTRDMVKIVAKAIFKNDKLIGLLGIQIDLSIIEEKLKDNHFGQTGYMMLLDEEGKALIHPSKDFIGYTPEIEGLKQSLDKKYETTSFNYSWNGTEKVMYCSKTNRGNFIVAGSVEYNELVNTNKNLLVMIILLGIISTIILTLCALVISIDYSNKQYKYSDKQGILEDNKKSNDLKSKLDRLKDYKLNGTLSKEEYELKRQHIIKEYEI